MNRKTRSSGNGHSRSEKIRPSPRSPQSTSRLIGSAAKANKAAWEVEAELVRFSTGDRSIDFNVDVTQETVWATPQQMADLYGRDSDTISKHIEAIFAEGELEERAVTQTFSVTAADGKSYAVKHYDLDVIVSVGYRVKSPQASAFRKWATSVLRSYITKGYSLNEQRLRNDPLALNDLTTKLRAIRAEEKHVFAKVRDFFKEGSSDYDGSAKACSSFFALLQDKFHFAACGLTACQLVLQRADHRQPGMGLTTFKGALPTAEEAKVGKNYLSAEELHVLRIVSEQFLLYVESKAIRGLVMTMKELAGKFDELLRVNGYEVFVGYAKDFQRDRANKHALAEYARFLVRRRKIA